MRDVGMIVVLEGGSGLGLEHATVRHRLLARLRAVGLDRELAAGASPESSVLLAVHAAHLCGASQRRLLTRSLRRLAAASEQPASSRLRTPLRRTDIRRARTQLEAVIERLGDPGPVAVRGVARVRLLLADGTGPFYRDSGRTCLGDELREALAALDSFT